MKNIARVSIEKQRATNISQQEQQKSAEIENHFINMYIQTIEGEIARIEHVRKNLYIYGNIMG